MTASILEEASRRTQRNKKWEEDEPVHGQTKSPHLLGARAALSPGLTDILNYTRIAVDRDKPWNSEGELIFACKVKDPE